MAWMLIKQKDKELYNVWSTVTDRYLFYDFDAKEVIHKKMEKKFIEEALRKLNRFMAKSFGEEEIK